MSHRRFGGYWLTRFSDDSGNVESALVLIPLMILFLSVAQIGFSVYSRNASGELTQGSVAFAAMGSPQLQTDSQASEKTSQPIALPLPGGGSILVEQRDVRDPVLTPLLPQGDNFQSTGIAVQE